TFSWYVASFDSYNRVYGSLGAAVGYMTWIWLSVVIVLLGAELNAEIERENALSVQEIFAIYGQEGYRRLEQAALRRLTEHPGPLILATSGGIVAEPLTYDLLLQAFYTIWLRARPEEHMSRVREQGHLATTGDHASAMQELRAVLASREPLYARAPATVDTSNIPVQTM
ncbi:YhjD/YihY/BrkB family envelope integrity protein, partial [Xanthomonas sontii]|uniref:YhjD/YihY/BrkB family envelope integrity protein n=1 Tax=Xanthomonas sontii TaxID=2650745 RepID=UPI0027F7293D